MAKKLIVTVSEELYVTVEKLAKDRGVSIPEYIRYLILQAKERDIVSELGL